MYDILAHHEAPLPDEINKQGFAVVTNPEIAIQEQKMAMENAKAQREEQQKLEGARQAKLEGDLGKLKDHSREADNPYFAKKISDFNQLVQDNIGDYYDKDIRKSSAAAMKIKEAANGLNSDIDYSNNLGKQEVYTDNLVDHNKPNYWNNDLTNWEANKKKSAFGDDKASISNAPEQRIDLAKKWKDEVMPRLAQTGDVTPVPVNLGNGIVDVQYKINNADAVDREKKAFLADQTVDNYLTKHLGNSSKDTQKFFTDSNTGEYKKRDLLDQLIPTETPKQKDVAKGIPNTLLTGGNSDKSAIPVGITTFDDGSKKLSLAGQKVTTIAQNGDAVDVTNPQVFVSSDGKIISGKSFGTSEDNIKANKELKKQVDGEIISLNNKLLTLNNEYEKDLAKTNNEAKKQKLNDEHADKSAIIMGTIDGWQKKLKSETLPETVPLTDDAAQQAFLLTKNPVKAIASGTASKSVKGVPFEKGEKESSKNINGHNYTLTELKSMAKSAGKDEKSAIDLWNKTK